MLPFDNQDFTILSVGSVHFRMYYEYFKIIISCAQRSAAHMEPGRYEEGTKLEQLKKKYYFMKSVEFKI